MIIIKVCIDLYGSVYFSNLKRFTDRSCQFGWILNLVILHTNI